MNKCIISVLFTIYLFCCCGNQRDGTIVRISNETWFTITDVQLFTETDTITATSISSSSIFEDTVILHSGEIIKLSWIENEQQRELQKALLDSVNLAEVVMFSILPDNESFEVFYHF